MGFVKCPRCELNYIRTDETMCGICAREVRGTKLTSVEEPTVELCAECGEAPAEEGEELCALCLRERDLQEGVLDAEEESDMESESLVDGEGGLTEISLEDNDDIPENELEEIDSGLSEEDNKDSEYADHQATSQRSRRAVQDVAI